MSGPEKQTEEPLAKKFERLTDGNIHLHLYPSAYYMENESLRRMSALKQLKKGDNQNV